MIQFSIFISLIGVCCYSQVSLESTYYPADGILSERLQLNLFAIQPAHFQITFPTSYTFYVQPHLFLSVYDLSWSNQLQFDLKIQSKRLNSANISSNINSSVIQLKMTYVVIDPEIFDLLIGSFMITSPQTNTNISITDHKKYQIVLLNSLHYTLTTFSFVQVLKIQHNQHISRDENSLSIEISSDIIIHQLKLSMFRISAARVKASYTRFGVAVTITTNTNTTLWDNIYYFEQDYDGKYFVGLQLLHKIKAQTNSVFSITGRFSINTSGYMSQIMNFNRFCPQTHPYFNLTALTCINTCGTSNYLNEYQICYPCDPSCQQCQGTSTNCSSCENDLVLISSNLEKHCGCNNGYFQQLSPIHTCLGCPLRCIKCLSPTSCSKCYPSFYYDTGQNKCLCRGTILTVSGIPKCVTSKIREKCKSSQILILFQNNACTCPSGKILIAGLCL